ncbi:hypothetical protein AWB81_08095 [Caballeronia arationis]|nr:hypothetical protein AWB81_08095 [Caballeronia arationis]
MRHAQRQLEFRDAAAGGRAELAVLVEVAARLAFAQRAAELVESARRHAHQPFDVAARFLQRVVIASDLAGERAEEPSVANLLMRAHARHFGAFAIVLRDAHARQLDFLALVAGQFLAPPAALAAEVQFSVELVVRMRLVPRCERLIDFLAVELAERALERLEALVLVRHREVDARQRVVDARFLLLVPRRARRPHGAHVERVRGCVAPRRDLFHEIAAHAVRLLAPLLRAQGFFVAGLKRAVTLDLPELEQHRFLTRAGVAHARFFFLGRQRRLVLAFVRVEHAGVHRQREPLRPRAAARGLDREPRGRGFVAVRAVIDNVLQKPLLLGAHRHPDDFVVTAAVAAGISVRAGIGRIGHIHAVLARAPREGDDRPSRLRVRRRGRPAASLDLVERLLRLLPALFVAIFGDVEGVEARGVGREPVFAEIERIAARDDVVARAGLRARHRVDRAVVARLAFLLEIAAHLLAQPQRVGLGHALTGLARRDFLHLAVDFAIRVGLAIERLEDLLVDAVEIVAHVGQVRAVELAQLGPARRRKRALHRLDARFLVGPVDSGFQLLKRAVEVLAVQIGFRGIDVELVRFVGRQQLRQIEF